MGNVLDTNCFGCPASRRDHGYIVKQSFSRSSRKSKWKRSYKKVMKNYLGLKPFKPGHINELSDILVRLLTKLWYGSLLPVINGGIVSSQMYVQFILAIEPGIFISGARKPLIIVSKLSTTH
jgi:hypothetical protein